jgi:2-dehydro-3-deoxyglucarate aldolase
LPLIENFIPPTSAMHFRTRLHSGESLFGTILTIPSAEIVEILVEAGYDWFFVDLEHSSMTAREAQLLLQVSAGRVPCLIRTENHQELVIRKALDVGADGIIVPQVNSAEVAQHIVAVAKYPPVGTRGAGLGRAQGYGFTFKDYVERANESLAVVVQIEHIEGVRNVDLILEVPGIDAVFIGPYDLSGSMGKLGQIEDKEVQQAIDTVIASAKRRKIPVGIFSTSAATVARYIEKGVSLIAVGTDALMLGSAARKELALLKR